MGKVIGLPLSVEKECRVLEARARKTLSHYELEDLFDEVLRGKDRFDNEKTLTQRFVERLKEELEFQQLKKKL